MSLLSEPKAAGVVFPYERQAANGDEMPSGLDYPDKVTYLCFRMLYAQLRMGIVDRETAIREKRKIMREYEHYKYIEQLGKMRVDTIRRTEMARAAYRKSRTLENADLLLIAIDGGDYRKKEGLSA